MSPLQIIKEHLKEHHPKLVFYIKPGENTGIIRPTTIDLNDPKLTKYIWITTTNKETTIINIIIDSYDHNSDKSTTNITNITTIDLNKPNSLTEISKIINKWDITC